MPEKKGPLAGRRVAITAERRAEELGELLRGMGAETLVAPTLMWTPLADDADLRATTESFVAAPPDLLVITTDRGFTGWLEAADAWGLGEGLATALRAPRIFTRGSKATAAVEAAGLRSEWWPEEADTGALLDHLVGEVGVAGKRVVIQLNSDAELPRREGEGVERKKSLSALRRALVAAGAQLVPLGVYRWRLPGVEEGDDTSALDELVDAIRARRIDAVTFTSAAAVVGLVRYADGKGCLDEVLAGFDHRDSAGALVPGGVIAACVGPICARPLEDLGAAPVYPAKGRLGALPRLVSRQLAARR